MIWIYKVPIPWGARETLRYGSFSASVNCRLFSLTWKGRAISDDFFTVHSIPSTNARFMALFIRFCIWLTLRAITRTSSTNNEATAFLGLVLICPGKWSMNMSNSCGLGASPCGTSANILMVNLSIKWNWHFLVNDYQYSKFLFRIKNASLEMLKIMVQLKLQIKDHAYLYWIISLHFKCHINLSHKHREKVEENLLLNTKVQFYLRNVTEKSYTVKQL